MWNRCLLEGDLVSLADLGAAGALSPTQRILTPVESLAGNPGKKLTMGLITQSVHGGARTWTLEDLHCVVPIELKESTSSHLVTDGSFVLAEGQMDKERGTFVADKIEVPPAVARNITMEKDRVPSNSFGGDLTEEQLSALKTAEMDNLHGMYVVVSEAHLDSVRVLEKLGDLFDTYEKSMPPTCYVLMGCFCSTPFVPTADGVSSYREGFERLKLIMGRLPNHIERGTRFIFIPGPQDPGAPTLPRTPLTNSLTADIASTIPGVILASNPCRIRHFGREIVFFRHDVLRLLRRHEVLALREPGLDSAPSSAHVRDEMVRLLFDQAHLVPLPLEESNILWSYDHTLRLYPLPDAVFIGGVSQSFETKYQGCVFSSVGPFHRDSQFHAYYPSKEEIEPCEVPDRAG